MAAACPSTSEQTTRAPSAAKAAQQARPIPPAAPVTSAVLPSRPVSTLYSCGAPGPHELHDLDRVPVRILDVDALAAAVGAARGRHRPGRPERHAAGVEAVALGVEVVGQEAEVCAADILESASAVGSARLLVLEQLEVVAEAAQVRDPDVRAGNARDALHVVTLDLAVGDDLEAEVAVEGDRPVDVGDRERKVVDAMDHVCLIHDPEELQSLPVCVRTFRTTISPSWPTCLSKPQPALRSNRSCFRVDGAPALNISKSMERAQTARERTRAALAHSEPDRVPADLLATPQIWDRLIEQLEVEPDPDVPREYVDPTREAILHRLDIDLRVLSYDMFCHPPERLSGGAVDWWGSLDRSTPNRMWRRRNMDGTTSDVWGAVRRTVTNELGAYDEFAHWPLQRVERQSDLEGHPWPEPDWWDFSGLPELVRQLDASGQCHLRYRIGSVFETAWQLRGMQELLMDLMIAPEIPRSIMNRIADVQSRTRGASSTSSATDSTSSTSTTTSLRRRLS